MRCKAQEEMHKAVPATVFGILSAFVLITQAPRFWPAVLRFFSGEILRPMPVDNESVLAFLCSWDGRFCVMVSILCCDVLLTAVTIYEYRLASNQDKAYHALDDQKRSSTVLKRRSSRVLEAVV